MTDTYRLFLAGGHMHRGADEREIDDLLAAVDSPEMDGLPAGWTWIAGLYLRSEQLVAVRVETAGVPLPKAAQR